MTFKNFKFTVLLSISVASFFSGVSIAAEKLTLERCWELAQKKSEDVLIQVERQFQAGEGVKQAKGDLLPNIRYEYLKTFRDTNGGEYDGDLDDGKFTLSQPLFYGSRKSKTIELSKVEVKKEGFIYKDILRNLKMSVTQVFFTIVQIDEDIANIQSTEKLLQDRLNELNERVRLGKSRESEVLMIASQIASLKAQEEKEQGDRAGLMEDLSFLTGVAVSSLDILNDTPSVETIEPLDNYLSVAKNRSDVEAVRQDLLSQAYRVSISKGSFLPAINLDGSWYTTRSGSLSSSKWDASISLDMPLFQGGIIRSKYNEQLSNLRVSEEKLSQIIREVTTEISKLYQSATSSVKQVTAYKDAYLKAEKSYSMQLKDYKFGLVNNLDVLQAMTSMLDVQRNFDRAIIQTKLNKTLLEIASEK